MPYEHVLRLQTTFKNFLVRDFKMNQSVSMKSNVQNKSCIKMIYDLWFILIIGMFPNFRWINYNRSRWLDSCLGFGKYLQCPSYRCWGWKGRFSFGSHEWGRSRTRHSDLKLKVPFGNCMDESKSVLYWIWSAYVWFIFINWNSSFNFQFAKKG